MRTTCNRATKHRQAIGVLARIETGEARRARLAQAKAIAVGASILVIMTAAVGLLTDRPEAVEVAPAAIGVEAPAR